MLKYINSFSVLLTEYYRAKQFYYIAFTIIKGILTLVLSLKGEEII